MRLLVVEDESNVAKKVESICMADGLVCHIAENGEDALEMLKFYDYGAIILDLMLPDMDGTEVLSRLRAINNNTPIIILSGLNSTDDKVRCLTLGADDYLTKPFSKIELLARIYAVIRRSSGHSSSIIKVGPMEIDINNRRITVNGREMMLTSKEYSILELLALKKGSILAKEAFLNHIYGGVDEPELKIVDVFICKLRKKIASMNGGISLIDTIWGRGYTLCSFDENDQQSIVEPMESIKVG
jgi:two-component system cell cycle response regulator CtrA